MAAVAPSFEACGVRIADDAVKGKVVFTDRAIKAGEVIFSEQAFVFAPWSTNVCDGCEEEKTEEKPECHCDTTGAPKQLYSEKLTKDVERRHEVVDFMANEIEGIGEVDRARCILRCLAMYERDNKALDNVLTLACANYESCQKEAEYLREQVPEIFPEGFTDEKMAKLIGVFNANAHELENLGGSGLFMSACRMEHNCLPNCSFTTYDSTLWMTAVRDIAEGEALSIDYGNFFYRPTAERMTSLFETYDFVCMCDGCVKNPDTCRGFKCSGEGCTEGVVYPYPRTPEGPIEDPEELEEDWKCSVCSRACTDEEIDAFETAEQEMLENGFPETLAEVDAYLKTSVMHPRHYLLFWALDAIGCEAAALNAFMGDESHHEELAEVWKRIIEYMNIVIPFHHHEKTIYYDNLAQVQVVLGKRDAAKAAYNEAFEVACVVSGRECTPTQKLKDLSENPPTTAEELRKLYEQVKRRDDVEIVDEDDEEWEDDEEAEEEEE